MASRLSLLLLLLGLISTAQPSLSQVVIPIGVLIPFDNLALNVSVRRVLDFTEWDLNNDPAYRIPNTTFRLIWTDSRSSLATTVGSAISLANRGVVGIVGEFSSGRTGPAALAMNSFGVYQCTVSTNPGLSDKSQYQYFFRTLPSDKLQGFGLVRLVELFGWKKVALITVNAPYGFGISSSFLELASAQNLTVLRNEAYNPDDLNYRLQISSLRQVDARIIVVLGYDIDVIYMLREARKQGMIGPKYVWIGSEAVETMYSLLFGDTASSWTDQDRENVEGMIFSSADETGMTEWTKLNTRFQAAYNQLPGTYSYFMRDCLLTMGFGVKRMLSRGFSVNQILSRTTNMTVTDFISTKFEGSTGNVSFDRFGDREGGFMYKSVIKGQLVNTYQTNFAGTFKKLTDVVFNGGSSIAPLDGVVLVRDILEAQSGFGIFIITANMFGAALCVLSGVMLVVKRSSPPVRQMSLPFLMIMLCGIIVEYFSVFGWIGKFEENRACGVQQWTGWIGYSLLLQGMLPKCWRVFRIFDNKKLSKTMKHLQDLYLVPLSIPITAVNVIIIGVWVYLDPIAPVYVSKTNADFHYECQSKSISIQDIMNATLMTYNALLICAAILLAYLTRNASSSYRETTFILYACQNVLICSVVVIALVYSGGGSYLATLYLRLVLTWVATTVAYAMTIGRTILAVTYELYNDARSSIGKSTSSMNGSELQRKNSKAAGHAGSTSNGANSGADTAERSALMDNSPAAFGGANFSLLCPIKDGARTFSKWETKKITFVQSHRYLVITDPQTGTGEVCTLGSKTVSVIKSMSFTDCCELRSPSKHRVIQLPDAASVEKMVKWFEPFGNMGTKPN